MRIKRKTSGKNVNSGPSAKLVLVEHTNSQRRTASLRENGPALSGRHWKVAALVARGYSNQNIAKELKLKEQVVKNAVHSLFARLGVRNRVELANYFSEGNSSGAVESVRRRIERDGVTELRRLKSRHQRGANVR